MFHPAKLLLFGEYAVLKGSRALAVPLSLFRGSWKYDTNPYFQHDLIQLGEYLKEKVENSDTFLNTDGFLNHLSKGLYFDSNIPRGYGAGSSGAVCAAVYERFGIFKTNDIAVLKQIFARMENYYHGNSSGFDPLISYLKRPVLINEDKTLQTIDLIHDTDLKIFLIDTKQPRKTEPLVQLFLEKCKEPTFNTAILEAIVPVMNQTLNAFLNQNTPSFFENLHQLSALQLQHLPDMIPNEFKGLWKDSLNQNDFKLKLCGAGGGGFILGFAKKKESLDFLSKNKIKTLFMEV
jgi:mevalonate kinase